MIPGEYKLNKEPILCNVGKHSTKIEVINNGDRPVQIGSHFHFYEINSLLAFERTKAYGKRLNIPAGTAVRFEPGDSKVVELIPFSGERKVFGLNNLTNAALDKGV
ncbi:MULTISPECIES: urease subunit beta [Metabacillus]|uniref:Urease subunit beta n=2 Tax=Metabacillus TaxID=2675233 RepID=A0A179SMC4_9BACI|nr:MULTISPECIES: urease subunit beta [Metabacillus]OAS82826.1 urease subunit beta [Metabacillus litoralis]QNF30269.1 urease subunit beta [Metabacillus sp. KUDC1714]